MPKLNEAEKRRADFVDGVPVEMADGQIWFLAQPLVRCGFSGESGFRPFLTLGDGYQELLDAVDEALAWTRGLEAMDEAERARAITENPKLTLPSAELAVGAALLRANYDLTDAELGRILQFGYKATDRHGSSIREAVLAVAYGNPPKPDGPGSGQA